MHTVQLFSDMYIHVQKLTHVYFNMSSLVELESQLFGFFVPLEGQT